MMVEIPLIKQLTQDLLDEACPVYAEGASAYMKHKFRYLGVSSPKRRLISKNIIKQFPVESIKQVLKLVLQLWKMPEREYQYFAIDLLAAYRKQWNMDVLSVIEHCITHKSWWDTVDAISSDWTGPYFRRFPELIPVTEEWNVSSNIWMVRSSLLFQKKYKTATDVQLLSRYILHAAGTKEFFINKAIGWALREYSYTNEAFVEEFVNQYPQLHPLSKREALKAIERKYRALA